MRPSVQRRLRIVATFLVAVMATSCTSGESADDGANGSVVVGSDAGAVPTDGQALPADPSDPTAAETAVGDDPAHGGGEAMLDEIDPVVESEDGQSTEPVGGGADIASPDQTPSAAEVCAAVEYGYLGLLDSDSSASRLERLRQGAEGARAIDDPRYADSGAELIAALDSGADTTSLADAADTLLDVCDVEGFERLT